MGCINSIVLAGMGVWGARGRSVAGSVDQRRAGPESQRPVVAKLLTDGRREIRGLEVSSLCFDSLEARRAVVGGVEAVASALDRPDREAVGGEDGACFCGEGHVAFVGNWARQLEEAAWCKGARCGLETV